MALAQFIKTPYNDITADYWKIIECNVNWLDTRSHVVMAGWVSDEARRGGKQPISQRNYDWSDGEFPFSFDELSKEGQNPVKIAYEKIKTLTNKDSEGNETPGEFNDAEDC